MNDLIRAVVVAAALAAGATSAAAQTISGLGGNRDVRVTADESLTWKREAHKYIAKGNAVAKMGERTLRAAKLVAFYRTVDTGAGSGEGSTEREGSTEGEGRTEIHRIEASGGVTLSGPNGTAHGRRGVYDLEAGVIVLEGGDLRMETSGGVVVTAGDRLEYWTEKNLAVARGDAAVVSNGRKLQARVVQAVFGGGNGGPPGDLRRVEAFDAVRIATANGKATGDMAIYDPETRVAEIFGKVTLSRGDTRLRGGYAKVSMNGGVSELRSSPPGEPAKERVRGLIAEPALERAAGSGDAG